MSIQSLKNSMVRVVNSYSVLIQQVTAGTIFTYLLFMIGFLITNPGVNYYSWRYFMTGPLMASYSTAFIMSLSWQTWLGIERMIRSTLRPSHVRLGLLTLAAFLNIFYFAWGVSIIWDIYI